jgi:hypothetical protein
MSPCYKGHRSNSEGTQRDLKQQKNNQTPRKNLKGLKKKEEELEKYNPSRE